MGGLSSFILSKIEFYGEECKLSNLQKLFSERLFSIPSYYTFPTISKFEINDKEVLKLMVKEPIDISIPSFDIYFESEIEILVYFIQFKEFILLVVSPRGFGLARKGNLRHYTDLTIWQNILENILIQYKTKYTPLNINQQQIRSQEWGEELKEIEVNVYEFGKIKLKSRSLRENAYTINKIIDFDKLISTGEISRIKVKSNKLKRIVGIKNDGVIKINEKDNEKVLKYLIKVLVRLP